MKKIIAITLAVLMAVTILAACGNNDTPAPTPAPAPDTSGDTSTDPAPDTAPDPNAPITFTYFQETINGTVNGIQNNPVADEIRRLTGVTLDVTTGDPELFSILAAGGDLPDIVACLGDATLANNLISSGQVIRLNELLDQYGQNIKRRIPIALEHSVNNFGDPDDDGLYYIYSMTEQADLENPHYNGFIGFFTRYDIYKAVGSPDVSTEEAYLAALKEMVDYYPTAPNGNKVYAFTGWSEMWAWREPYGRIHHGSPAWIITEDKMTGEFITTMSAPDETFWQSCRFYNKAHQMGLLDPEAFIMNLDQFIAKIQGGEVLVAVSDWWPPDPDVCGEDAALFMLPGPFPVFNDIYPTSSDTGYSFWWSNAITSNCADPVRAMQFLDWCNSDEGSRLIISGIEGVHWDYVDGTAQFIGDMFKYKTGDSSVSITYDQEQGVDQLRALTGGYWMLDDGVSNNLSLSPQLKIVRAQENPIAIEFSQKYGGPDALYPGQAYHALVKSGQFQANTVTPEWWNLVSWSFPDEINLIYSRVEDYFVANIGKILMSSSDAEFEKAVTNAIADLEAMDIQLYIDAVFASVEAAKAEYAAR